MNFFQQQTQVVHLDAENRVTVRRLTFGAPLDGGYEPPDWG